MSGNRTRAHLRISGTTSRRAASRTRRHLRVRKKVSGSPARPRLVIAQLVDDTQARTLVSASTMDAAIRGEKADKTAKARQVGALLAQRAAQAGITTVVFDRGGYAYHGRVAALAEGAREGGLEL